jgi:hypothetical protein
MILPMNRSIYLASLALVVSTPALVAQNPVYTSVEEARAAGLDYDMQGEYAVGTPGSGAAIGVQIVALGDLSFRWVEYAGGLPGAGATGKPVRSVEAKAAAGRVVFERGDAGKAILLKEGVMIETKEGKKVQLAKVERKSPTLGKKPPQGAVVLFDGTNTDAWNNGQMTPDGLLMQGPTSKQAFGDHTIHLEFRTPFKPFARGQDRGNSGLYMQGRYETQVLDSFGLEGKMDETGGVYSIAAPAINMCLPPLSWQTYDVEFTAARFDAEGKKTANARMTVLLNGVKVHDNLDLTHSTTASPLKEGPELGPVFLQDHGNPVRYRNVWVVPAKP